MSPREKPRASGGTCSPGHGGRTSPGAAVRSGLCQDTAHQSVSSPEGGQVLFHPVGFALSADPCQPRHRTLPLEDSSDTGDPRSRWHGEQGRPRTEMHTGRAGRLAGGKCSRVEDGL